MKFILLVLTLLNFSTSLHSEKFMKLGGVGPFSLTDQSGQSFTEKDLEGRFWIVNFIFTRCTGPCPALTRTLSKIQERLPAHARLLSISVDPKYDTPQILSEYAEKYGAHYDQWKFLTGPRDQVYRLIKEKLLNPVQKDPHAKHAGEAFIHSQKFVLLDGEGHIRNFYNGEDSVTPNRIINDLNLLNPKKSQAPAFNAAMNLTSAFFIIAGYFFIRLKRIQAHRVSMGLAFIASAIFLVSYIIYHMKFGSTSFSGEGPMRIIYFSILISHSILSMAVVPMVLITLIHAIKGNFEAHKKIARWTFPIWLYVSVTGVTVYWMLYRL